MVFRPYVAILEHVGIYYRKHHIEGLDKNLQMVAAKFLIRRLGFKVGI